jgi:hypothetical protein
MNWLSLVLIIALLLDACASALAAWQTFRLRNRLGRYMALMFSGVAVEAWTTTLVFAFSSDPFRSALWIVAPRITARLFKTATIGALLLFLLGFMNGVTNHDHAKLEIKNDPE